MPLVTGVALLRVLPSEGTNLNPGPSALPFGPAIQIPDDVSCKTKQNIQNHTSWMSTSHLTCTRCLHTPTNHTGFGWQCTMSALDPSPHMRWRKSSARVRRNPPYPPDSRHAENGHHSMSGQDCPSIVAHSDSMHACAHRSVVGVSCSSQRTSMSAQGGSGQGTCMCSANGKGHSPVELGPILQTSATEMAQLCTDERHVV